MGYKEFLPPGEFECNTQKTFDIGASNVKACQVCLAVNVKLQSVQCLELSGPMESLQEIQHKPVTHSLPQYLCYMCVADVMKCHRLVERCKLSQKLLLKIFRTHGEVKEDLISNYDLCKFNNRSLTICRTNKYFHFKYNDSVDPLQKGKTLEDNKKLIEIITRNVTLDKETPVVTKVSTTNKSIRKKDKTSSGKNVSKINTDLIQRLVTSGNNISITNKDLTEPLDTLNENISNEDVTQELATSSNNVNDEDETQQLAVEKVNPTLECIGMDEKSVIVEKVDEAGTLEYIEEEVVMDFDEEVYLEDFSNDNSDADENYEPCGTGSDIEFDNMEEEVLEETEEQDSDDSNPEDFTILKQIENPLLKCFSIVELTPAEQLEEWDKFIRKRNMNCDNVYECDTCHMRFKTTATVDHHAHKHYPGLSSVACPVCKIQFKSSTRMRCHVENTHAKKFYCRVCPKAYSTIDEAQKHLEYHSARMYRCGVCPFETRHLTSFLAHKVENHTLPYPCPKCGRGFKNTNDLKHHHTIMHETITVANDDDDVGLPHRCELCGIGFPTADDLTIHMTCSKQHSKTRMNGEQTDSPYVKVCRYMGCSQEFKTQNELSAHVKAEHPVPQKIKVKYPTKCQHCEEIMRTARQYWAHVRLVHPTETSTYPAHLRVICDICGKGCANFSLLAKHKLRHSVPRVTCHMCPRRFFDKNALARHMSSTHSQDRPHVCNICGKAFKTQPTLKNHARVHSDVMPYECWICKKGFKSSSSITSHIRTIHFKFPPQKSKMNRRSRNKKRDLEC